MPNLFVIGASGYVGKVLIKSAGSNYMVYGTSTNGGNGLLRLRLDMPSNFDYRKIREGDFILLAAAISSPDVCTRERDFAWNVNVSGTKSFIAKAIDRGARVVFFSSDTVYGECANPFDEMKLCSPIGLYAMMKHEVEQHFMNEPNFKSIRLSYMFSIDDNFTRYLVRCAQDAEIAEVFHPFYRSIIHRNDAVDGILALVEQWDNTKDKVINFGGPQIVSRVEFAECLRSIKLKSLRFKMLQPDEIFFKSRPRVIAMTSPQLEKLLGRGRPRTIYDAALLEFPF
jgi:dTDP-4-dehydrorhamnose reductase